MFVVVGYLLHDVLDNDGVISNAPGGAATYCGITAKRLGLNAGVVSKVGHDYAYRRLLDGIDAAIGVQERTTTFINTNRNGVRVKQQVKYVGEKLKVTDFPERFLKAAAVHIGPVIDEIDPALLAHVKQNSRALVSMDPQGFMRRYDEEGNVMPKDLNLELLKYVDIVHVSEDDRAASQIDEIVGKCPRVLLTNGAKGSIIYWDGREIEIPAYKIQKIADPTGAGDVCTAAFVKRFLETKDPEESGRYASAAASFCVEGVGVSNLPTDAMVKERMRNGETNF